MTDTAIYAVATDPGNSFAFGAGPSGLSMKRSALSDRVADGENGLEVMYGCGSAALAGCAGRSRGDQ
jgi:hypothetical protein